jgi:predicted DNA-binding protein
MKEQTKAVRISTEQYDALRALAARRGVMISWLLTKAVDRYLKESKVDLAPETSPQ